MSLAHLGATSNYSGLVQNIFLPEDTIAPAALPLHPFSVCVGGWEEVLRKLPSFYWPNGISRFALEMM